MILHPLADEHVDRWLELFRSTVDENVVDPTAEVANRRATKMAGAISRILAGADTVGDASERREPVTVGGRPSRPRGI